MTVKTVTFNVMASVSVVIAATVKARSWRSPRRLSRKS